MGYIVSIATLLVGISKKRSNIVFLFSLTLIFILFGWSHNLADETNYINRYYRFNVAEVTNITGTLYTELKALANGVGLTYEGWLIVQALFYTLSAGLISMKLSNGNRSFPIVMLLIFPMCMDVTQQRQTFGMCIGWIAIYILCTSKNRKIQMIPYTILVLLASMVHELCFFYLLYFIAKYYKKTQGLYIFVGFMCILLFAVGSPILTAFGNHFFPAKTSQILASSSSRFNLYTHYTMWLKMASVFLTYYFPYMYIHMFLKYETTEFQDFVYRANIIALLAVPLILFSDDYYRVQQILLLFDYCAVSQSIKTTERFEASRSNCILIGSCVIFAFVALFLQVLNNASISTAFKPFFENNLLLGGG